jgi:hypothetical protein
MAKVGQAETNRCEDQCAAEGNLVNKATDALNKTGPNATVNMTAETDFYNEILITGKSGLEESRNRYL